MSKIKLVALVLALVLVLPAALFAAQARDIVFTVGQASYQSSGESIPMDAAPVIIDGHTYLPVRDVAEAMGLGVSWDPANQTVTLDNSNTETISGTAGFGLPISVSIGKGSMVNGLIDTGSVISGFPETYLKKLGYSPISITTVSLASGNTNVNVYNVPYPIAWQNGVKIPLGNGYIKVLGLPGTGLALIGLNIISADNFNLHGGTWSLIVPAVN